ncbi:MAG: ATP-binding cassette domain-containing protein [Treponemataceae bacterium]
MVLEIKDLHKNFGDLEVLKGVSFKATSGETFAFLGRNGAGKSTTFHIIVDVFRANSGEILLDGKPFDYNTNEIGYIPEEKVLYQKKKILDQMVYFAELKGLSRKEATNRVMEYLERLELAYAKDKLVNTLSKGNQQKLQMIIALAHDPKIIILDEPFSGLDPVNAEILKTFVREEVAKDKIVLLSSHQMNYVEEFCSEMAILSNGKVAITGNIAEIKRSYERNRLAVVSPEDAEISREYSENIHEQNDNVLTLKFVDIDAARKAMTEITSRHKVDSIKLVEPSLNDIFVQYTS